MSNQQKIQLVCKYDPSNDKLKINASNNISSINQEDRYKLEDAVSDIIGSMNSAINAVIENSGGSKILSEGRAFIIEVGYDYALNLKQAREKYGEEGYRDELSAIGQSLASFATGFVGSEAGSTIGFLLSQTLPGKIGGAIAGGLLSSRIYDKYIEQPVESFFEDIFASDLFGDSSKNSLLVGYDSGHSGENSMSFQREYYQIENIDSFSNIADSIGVEFDDLMDSNSWIKEKNRISQDGEYVFVKPDEKFSISLGKIDENIAINDLSIKGSFEDGSSYNDKLVQSLLLNQYQNSISLDLGLEKGWQTQDLKNINLDDIKLEFNFDTKFNNISDLSQSYNPDSNIDINNTLLNLTINTNLTKNFRPTSSPTQIGNAIDGGDYFIESDINVLNGDGVENTTPMGMVTDNYRPGNTELSTSMDFIDNLTLNLDKLSDFQDDYVVDDNDNFGGGLDYNLADLFNQSQNAKNFLNIDPVILDLNNDNKINLISYQESQVTFDVDNDNKQERTGWVGGEEGILVHDLNNDGKINDITETVSEYYNPNGDWIKGEDGKYSKHGLAALKKLDSNNDDKFDAKDDFFDKLKIWQDANENGVTDLGELKTLTQAEIKEFDLSQIIEIDKERNAGNVILAKSSFTTIYGQKQLVKAVDFTTNPIGYEFNDVNLGRLATTEDGTKTLALTGEEGKTVDAAKEGVINIFGAQGNDQIIGDAQNNMLSGGAGSDIIKAGDGDDILIIDDQDKQENIDGGNGRDIAIINSDNGVALNLAKANIETAIGGNGDDILISGSTANTFIDGGNGDDVIVGGAADDALSGSDGDDYIDGAFGDDIIRGHRGQDLLIGGKGDDLIDGGLDNDELIGGDGKDILIGGKGSDKIDGGDGHDLAKYAGNYENYQIFKEDNQIKVKDLKTNAIDTLKNIEAIRFDNVTIKIEDNTAPLAVADKITIENKEAFFINKQELLKNDIDLENHSLDITQISNAIGGTAKIVKDDAGNITGINFTPGKSYNGVMSFDYSVIDEKGATTIVTQHNNDGTSQEATHKARVQFKLSDDPTDPLYYDQWYLSEINAKGAWQDYSGKGVSIGIFEQGDFNRHHEDLKNNIAQDHIKDQEFRQIDRFSQHKTTVAGVIAAQNNDYGTIGVAHGATITGYSWDADETGFANLKNVDIANNSWGASMKFADNFADSSSPYYLHGKFLEESVKEGRHGLGTINIFAGGNDRESGDNVNYHNLQNSRFVIATGSINQDGDLGALIKPTQPFSNPGAAILVSAPGSNIESTGNLLENNNGSQFLGEFSASQGTSFSAPIISGIVALMLEANSGLGYRDVQKILALSAKKINDPNTSWQENGTNNFNGGGMHYSHDYGFGIVDAKAAVRLAEIWDEVNGFFNESSYRSSQRTERQLKDNAENIITFDVDGVLESAEHVELFVDIEHNDISELEIALISPSGTKSILMQNPEGQLAYKGGLFFNFSSRSFLGEEMDGEWKVIITDNKSGNVAKVNSLELKFHGTYGDGANDTYFYNSEIENASKFIITDNDGGIDTINAVMTDGDNIINLNAGKVSRINNTEISISSNQKTEEYSAQEQELAQKQSKLLESDSILAQKKQNVKQKEQELENTVIAINAKVAEFNEIDPKFQAALKEFNEIKAWFDNHEYQGGIKNGSHITYIFKRKSDGAQIHLNEQQYKNKVNDHNSKLNKALSLQDQRNKIVDEYNHLNARKDALPDEIESAKQEAETQYQKSQDLSKEVAFLQDYLDSFNDENNTIIENAYSGDGDDKIIGNEYDNRIMGGRGENELTGGQGRDVFVIKKGAEKDIITDFNAQDDRIDLSDFDLAFANLNISQQNSDTIIKINENQEIILKNTDLNVLTEQHFRFNGVEVGSEGDDVIRGTDLNDEIDGKAGDDVIYGNKGNDEIRGGSGNDRIYGGKGNDVIYDGAGKDVVYAGDGDDYIIIEGGNTPSVYINGAFSEIDSGFFGGKGNDIFVISDLISGGGFLNNLIYDFEVENPREKIDLSAFTNVHGLDDLNFGNISINGEKYLRVTILNQEDLSKSANITLKNVTRDQINEHNFIFAEKPELTAQNDEFSTLEDNQITISFEDLLANDSENGHVGEIIANVKNGTLELRDGKYFIYTPKENFNGADSFEYETVFSNGERSTATVKINITQVNDAPTLKDFSVTIDEDTSTYINVLKDAFDVEGDNLTITEAKNSQNATVEIIEGRLKYTPNQNFSGTDYITYKITDGENIVEKQLKITVNEVNDAPIIEIPTQIAQKTASFDLDLSKFIEDDGDFVVKVMQKDGSKLPSYLQLSENKLSFKPSPALLKDMLALTLEVFDGKNSVQKDFSLIFDRNLENQIIIAENHGQVTSTIFRDVIFANAKNNIINLTPDGQFDEKSLGEIDITKRNFFNDFVDGADGVDRVVLSYGDDAIFYENSKLSLKNIEILEAKGGNDVIIADNIANIDSGEGDDVVIAQGFDDKRIWAGAGDDFVATGQGNDDISLQDGDDKVNSGAGNDVIRGGSGDDEISAGSGDDQIYGGNGNNILNGDAGNDNIYGGANQDKINGGDGNDRIHGESGDDIIDGGSGDDILSLGSGENLAKGGLGDDRIYAGNENDEIHGDEGQDYIRARGGNDVIYGGADNDRIYAESGDDIVDAGTGDDYVKGDSGNDKINGGDGNDALNGGFGNDEIHGDAGDDHIWGQSGNDIITGGLGNDMLSLGSGDDNANGDAGQDRIYGGDGNDEIKGGEGNDYLRGNNDNDKITGGAGKDRIFGDSGNDNLAGGQENDVIYGGSGQDIISGDAGDDILNGGSDDDIINGGLGNDKIHGEQGNDIVNGGSGNDILSLGYGDDIAKGESGDDRIYAGSGADKISGGQGNDYIKTGQGDDNANGDEGNDRIYGEDGNDTLNGGSGNDYIRGDNGNDTLNGDAGNDIIRGGDGNDIINGGQGRDVLTGDRGADVFLYQSLEDSTYRGLDTITDFTQGVDKIDLSLFEFDQVVSGNDNQDNYEKGVLKYYHQGNSTIIEDENSDFTVKLQGKIELEGGDFIF